MIADAGTDEDPNYLIRLRLAAWHNLPTLLVSSSTVCAAAAVVLLVTPGITPLSLLLWAVLVAPTFGALVAQANQMMLGAEPATFSVIFYLRRVGRLSLAIGLAPALAGACSLVALQVWGHTRSALALLSVGVGGAVTVLLCIGSISALPLGIQFQELRGPRLMLMALHVAAKRPVSILAVAALAVVAVWASVQFTASIIFLLPGPLALVLVGAVWTSADACNLRPGEVQT